MMKKKTKHSNRVCFALSFILAISITVMLLGFLYKYFEDMTSGRGSTEPTSISFESEGEVQIKKMTVETFSFSELTLAKLFNGHAVNDDLNIFDNMMSGFNLSVVIATAFVTRVEVYANERTETIMHGESETTYEELQSMSSFPPGKATTVSPEVGQVNVELCEMIDSNSCSLCATSNISEFREVIFDTYDIYNGRGQRFQKFSQRVMKCLASSQIFQVVKLVFITNEIRPTEITIFGNEVIDEEIRRIEIHRATEEGKQGSSGSVDKAIDREFGTKETNCYVATTISSWLSLEFTWSSITHVDILVPITAEKTEGVWVDVCSYGRRCIPCGVLTATPSGEWGGVYCVGGMIPGNEVQLRHSYQTLVLCEVAIFGKTTAENSEGVIGILQIQGSFLSWRLLREDPISTTTFRPPEVVGFFQDQAIMYDNRWLTGYYDCYATFDRIVFVIKQSRVHYVKLLSSVDTEYSRETFPYDAEVMVCDSKNLDLCIICGHLTINEGGSWGTVFCPETGLDGSHVTVQKPSGDILAICEIEIHGETLLS